MLNVNDVYYSAENIWAFYIGKFILSLSEIESRINFQCGQKRFNAKGKLHPFQKRCEIFCESLRLNPIDEESVDLEALSSMLLRLWSFRRIIAHHPIGFEFDDVSGEFLRVVVGKDELIYSISDIDEVLVEVSVVRDVFDKLNVGLVDGG